MRAQRLAMPRPARFLGIILLILGVGRVPLPRAEFHTVRHQDGPHQECVLHEHLLRWHPAASDGESVPLLHWHWVLPRLHDPRGPVESDDPSAAFLTLTADSLIVEDGAPIPGIDALPQTLDRPAITSPFLHALASLRVDPPVSPPPRPAWDKPPTLLARCASLCSLLQRWTC